MSAALRTLLAAVLIGASGLLAAPHAQAAKPVHVMIENYKYSPSSLSVQAGDTVTWTNHDEAKHDVVTTSGPETFRSPMLAKGQSWSHTFQAAGSYSYYCSVHPDMRAGVSVKAAAQPTTAPPKAQPTQQQSQQPQAAPPQSSARASSVPQPSAAPQPSAPVAVPPAAAPQAVPAAQQQSIDPMLLVAGVVTGVAVLCLLLLGARRPD